MILFTGEGGSPSLIPCSFWGSLSLVPCSFWEGSLYRGSPLRHRPPSQKPPDTDPPDRGTESPGHRPPPYGKKWAVCILVLHAVADIHSKILNSLPPPPIGPNVFISMQFSKKYGRMLSGHTASLGNPGSAAGMIHFEN